jgi:hypothetical protein
MLETYAGTPVGTIQLASASDNLEITVANQTLTFNNVWGTF